MKLSKVKSLPVNTAAEIFLNQKRIRKVYFFVHFAGRKILIVTRLTEYIVHIVETILSEMNEGLMQVL